MSLKDFGSASILSSSNSVGRYQEGEHISDSEKSAFATRQWATVGYGKYLATSDTHIKLPAGAYEVTLEEQSRKPLLVKKNLVHDKIIPLSGLPQQIVGEIAEFWDKEVQFSKLGFLHRRGYLLYGAHGTGKSSLVYEIADSTARDGGVVLYCNNPEFFQMGLAAFRQVEPERPLICIFEDIDAIIKRHGESVLLSVLDGENQISRVCNIATTNYPELLDKRIVGRPRRFDRVYRIGSLDERARLVYLKNRLPKGADVKKWVKKTDGLSIASISEAIISVFCFDKDLDEAVKIMQDLSTDKSSEEYKEGVGIGYVEDDDEGEY